MLHGDVPFGQVGRHLFVGYGLKGKCGRQIHQEILVFIQKRQPARLHFFNDRNLDPIHHGQTLALHLAINFLRAGIVCGRFGFVIRLSEIGIFHEHHLG